MSTHILIILLVIYTRKGISGKSSSVTLQNLFTTPSATAAVDRLGRAGFFSDFSSDFGDWEEGQPLGFAAFSPLNTDIIDPMSGYDPLNVRCLHRGAYFLPHPKNCEKYYVCAFGHLLLHHCGRGTIWNYKETQCELNILKGKCYSLSPMAPVHQTTNAPVLSVEDSSKNQSENRKASTGHKIKSTQFIELSKATKTIRSSTYIKRMPLNPPTPPVHLLNATFSSFSSTTSGLPVDNNINLTEPSPTNLDASVPRYVPKCNQGNKYLADSTDCRHYYICIQSMPIGMFCPEGAVWSSEGEFCAPRSREEC